VSKVKGTLSGGRVLTEWQQEESAKGNLIGKIIDSVNGLARNVAASAVGRSSAPPPINGINVKTSGEYAHITIDHAGEIQQGCHYFVEVANNEGFANAHPIHFGTSRTRDPIFLPAKDDAGNPQKWYVRGYAQYPSSSPSAPVSYHSAVTTSGTTQLSLLPSTGSGTAKANGSQPGWGFGKIQVRRK